MQLLSQCKKNYGCWQHLMTISIVADYGIKNRVVIGGHPTTYHTPHSNEVEGVPWVWGGSPRAITLKNTNVSSNM